MRERVTLLYENASRFNPLHPRVFDSKPFQVNQDGTFIDRQVLGQYGQALPDKMMQVVKQELIVNEELRAIIYLVRTPKDVKLIGYSAPPLLD